jgi:3-isopropylmalate/(R)-2-methylmalate dehydratase large subunit
MAPIHALHKILANCSRPRRDDVAPGEFVEVEPDVFGVIVAINGAEQKRFAADLEELGIKELPLKDRIYAVSDHASPAPTVAIAQGQKLWRDFFRDHGVRVFDGGAGISHLILCEQGLVRPGMLAIVIDSHAPTMGAIGMYASSLGGGRLTLYAIGRYVMQAPKVTLVRVSGTLKPGLSGRDASLYINGKLGQRGAYGNAVEFAGPFIDALSMDMRFTFANMGTEMGAVTSYMQPDVKTLHWVKDRAVGPYTVYETDPGFEYDSVHEVDVSEIEPQIAVPHAPDDVHPVSEIAGRRIDQAYIGSCASGRLEDMAAAAQVLKGRKVHPDVRLVVTPGSREVLIAATAAGYIQTLHEANAIVTSANCGACPGLHGGLLAPGDVAITSITRNFEGRMGPGGEIYLASPATVAASAIEGHIASPLQYLGVSR